MENTKEMNPQSEADQRLLELRKEGKSKIEIVEILNRENFKTATGKTINVAWIGNRLVALNRPRRFYNKKPNEMITIPVEMKSKTHGKVIAVLGEFEDVASLIDRWVNNG